MSTKAALDPQLTVTPYGVGFAAEIPAVYFRLKREDNIFSSADTHVHIVAPIIGAMLQFRAKKSRFADVCLALSRQGLLSSLDVDSVESDVQKSECNTSVFLDTEDREIQAYCATLPRVICADKNGPDAWIHTVALLSELVESINDATERDRVLVIISSSTAIKSVCSRLRSRYTNVKFLFTDNLKVVKALV